MIEKHLTLDRNLAGPDHQASLEPGEFAALMAGVRRIEQALGDGVKRPVEAERSTAAVARKSLTAARDLPAGTVLTRDAMVVRRPGTGLAPARLEGLIGRRTRAALSAGETLTEQSIE